VYEMEHEKSEDSYGKQDTWCHYEEIEYCGNMCWDECISVTMDNKTKDNKNIDVWLLYN
jgi:hypothetical protein